jgi:hypothetical protein
MGDIMCCDCCDLGGYLAKTVVIVVNHNFAWSNDGPIPPIPPFTTARESESDFMRCLWPNPDYMYSQRMLTARCVQGVLLGTSFSHNTRFRPAV